MSKFGLQGKVAIVTGGAGGIGTAIAMAYAEAGAKVVVASRKQANLDKVAAKIESLGGESLAVATDITVPEQVDNMVKQTVDKFGRLDILVNNAGGAMHMKKAEDLTPDEWRAGMAFNLDGTFFCSVAAFRVMKEQRSGKIVNISSVAGIKDAASFPHYGASKAGVISLTRTLAAGWAPYNIHVNCIAPGLTATESLRSAGWLPPETDKNGTPVPKLLRPLEPENVAALAVFLGSEASDNLTGELIPIRASFPSDR